MRRTAVFCLGALLLAGCRHESQPKEDTSYQLKGIVVAPDPARGEVSIDGQAIPGFMGAMTMSYKLAQPGIASELHPGDRLTARLKVEDGASTLDQIVVVAQAKPDYLPPKIYNLPTHGQEVPDFKLTNQDGKTISISQFRGQFLLLTFIYTRCPLPDYCIRMSRNFATIQKQLADDPRLYDKTHLLSISFDPAYDTPKVLHAYGAAYAGSHGGQAFDHWDFAVPTESELDKVNEFFDVGVTAGGRQTLNHSLSTALIDPSGRIFRWYPSNDWDPAAVVNDLRQAAAHPGKSATVSH